ncbi:hypothetical protein BQ1740_0069 [Bacillus subtilis]|nr:hypothetical protein BQ1740_0069 [Bacillus subtilis]
MCTSLKSQPATTQYKPLKSMLKTEAFTVNRHCLLFHV